MLKDDIHSDFDRIRWVDVLIVVSDDVSAINAIAHKKVDVLDLHAQLMTLLCEGIIRPT